MIVSDQEAPVTDTHTLPPRPMGITRMALRQKLLLAIQVHQPILIRYAPVGHSKNGNVTQAKNEIITPDSVVSRNNVEYLMAHDVRTGGIKSFLLSRIFAIKMMGSQMTLVTGGDIV